MKSIKGTRTEENLLKAFAGESQARNRYNFFAARASSRQKRLVSNSLLYLVQYVRLITHGL